MGRLNRCVIPRPPSSPTCSSAPATRAGQDNVRQHWGYAPRSRVSPRPPPGVLLRWCVSCWLRLPGLNCFLRGFLRMNSKGSLHLGFEPAVISGGFML